MNGTIMINKVTTLELQPGEVGTVLDALAELPFKRANPVVQNIMAQLQKQAAQVTPPEPPAAPSGEAPTVN